MLRKILFEADREVLDRILRPGGKRQDVIRAARQSFRPEPCRRFLDNDVRVRAAESETAHTGETPGGSRPGLRFAGNNDSCAGEGDSGIQLCEMQLAGYFMVVKTGQH